MSKISAVYQIINDVTGDRYVGSSRDVKERWYSHKSPSRWKDNLNNPMYLDMQKYGLDKFRFQILCPVEPEHLKDVEQELIEMIHPTYNNYMAKGVDVERKKKYKKEWTRRWCKTDKGKEVNKKANKKYKSQLCVYNGKTLTLNALACRFHKAGIPHPNIESRKYLIEEK